LITKPEPIHPGITILYGGRAHGRHPYVNAIEISGSSRVLIDPGLCHAEYLAPRFDSYDLVVDTHCHPDHTSLNHRFPCPRACHAAERPYIEDPGALRDAQGLPTQEFRDEWQRLVERLWDSRPCNIEQTLKDGDEIDVGRVRLRVLHTPGHSLGHLSFFHEASGILIAGDYDLNPLSAIVTSALSDLDLWHDSFQRLIELEPRVLVTGHMQAVTEDVVDRMIAYRDLLLSREESIRVFLKQPRRLEAVHEFVSTTFRNAASRRRPISRWFLEVAISYHVQRLIRRGDVRMLGAELVAARGG
jgi:glyoxylase-like metal-dependent hydrolase (beta-lactamase superfamily II)